MRGFFFGRKAKIEIFQNWGGEEIGGGGLKGEFVLLENRVAGILLYSSPGSVNIFR